MTGRDLLAPSRNGVGTLLGDMVDPDRGERRGLRPSLEAHRPLPGVIAQCSWRTGWRSLLLRAFNEPAAAEEFTTVATSDQLVVLLVAGRQPIEVRHRGQWRQAQYGVGSLGMTAPGHTATLRWRAEAPIETLHLYLPERTMRSAVAALWDRDPHCVAMPDALQSEDPLVQQVMQSLREAMLAGVPDLYAETAADFLAVHLLRRHAGLPSPGAPGREELRLRRVNAYMRERLDAPISLDALAREAGLSRFHLLRSYKKAFGETPFRRLTRLRMEQAQCLLSDGHEAVTEIAMRCGYDNPSHFATAFRRAVGVSPSAYRHRRCS